MINAVRFHVLGEPVAKGRARSAIRAGRIMHYTPDATMAYEAVVAKTARTAMGPSAPIAGPVVLSIAVTCAIPPSWSKKRQAEALGRPKTSRCDIDNYAKALLDGCNGIVWNDDAQVWNMHCTKVYGLVPGVVVEVTA